MEKGGFDPPCSGNVGGYGAPETAVNEKGRNLRRVPVLQYQAFGFNFASTSRPAWIFSRVAA